MPNQFNQGTVQQYGGVAWAKQQVEAADADNAIGAQISGYTDVNRSLNSIVDTLNNANASLQSAWSGDAASAAAQTFTDTSNHAQNVITTVNNTITQLKSAQSAAQAAKLAMRNVPDEKPIPSGNFFSGFTNAMSDLITGTDPVQQAQQHNTAARTQAADVLNQLSNHYDSAANGMNSIAASTGKGSGFTPSSPPPSGSFNLGSGSYSGGSGAAAGYSFTSRSSGGRATSGPSSGGVANGVFHDGPPPGTVVQGVTPTAPPPTPTPPGLEDISTATTTTTPGPIFGTPANGLSLPPNEELNNPGGAGSAFGDGPNESGTGGRSKLSSSNVFGEDGFGDGTGSTNQRTASSLGSGLDGEEGPGGPGGRAGGSSANGEQSGMQGMGGRRGGGGASSEEELGSSKYSRGRFFGGEEPGSGEEEWVQPSIGGNESLFVKDGGRGAGTGRVASAYDGATDADGNPLHMMRGFGRRGTGRDEDDERSERPDYLKEDPEWWQSAQRVAPPVVE